MTNSLPMISDWLHKNFNNAKTKLDIVEKRCYNID